MVPSKAAAPSCNNTQANMTPKHPKEHPVAKSLAAHAFAFMIRNYFPTLAKPTQFSPVTTMNQLFHIMLKDKLSLVLCNLTNDKQVILESALLPTGKNEFQKFCTVSMT